MQLEQVDAESLVRERDAICALVRDTVEDGASIGFVLPLADDVLAEYADSIVEDVRNGNRVVVLARDGAGAVIGMVHLELPWKPNARHRAEVQKLMVHTSARRQGLSRLLMTEIERIALEQGRTLLMLDTEQSSPAESLYRTSGWTDFGVVPGHAAQPHGQLSATTFFYKRLVQ